MCFQASAMHLIKKKDFLDKSNDWTKNYDSSGEETAKKKRETISNFFYYGKIGKISIFGILLDIFLQCLSLRLDKKYFQSFKASYEVSYKTSEMLCFRTQCIQNKTFETPRMRPRMKLWMTRTTDPELLGLRHRSTLPEGIQMSKVFQYQMSKKRSHLQMDIFLPFYALSQ